MTLSTSKYNMYKIAHVRYKTDCVLVI